MSGTLSRESSPHSLFSQTREKMFEHLFVGELMRELWRRAPEQAGSIQILFAETDNAGFDVVLQYRGITRFVQLKAAVPKKTKKLPINMSLRTQTGSCVLVMEVNESTLEVTGYRWWGSGKDGGGTTPAESCYLEGLPPAKHPQTKKLRKNTVSLPLSRMRSFSKLSDVCEALFPALQSEIQ